MNRLDEIIVNAKFFAVTDIAVHTTCGQKHEGNSFPMRIFIDAVE